MISDHRFLTRTWILLFSNCCCANATTRAQNGWTGFHESRPLFALPIERRPSFTYKAGGRKDSVSAVGQSWCGCRYKSLWFLWFGQSSPIVLRRSINQSINQPLFKAPNHVVRGRLKALCTTTEKTARSLQSEHSGQEKTPQRWETSSKPPPTLETGHLLWPVGVRREYKKWRNRDRSRVRDRQAGLSCGGE